MNNVTNKQCLLTMFANNFEQAKKWGKCKKKYVKKSRKQCWEKS